MKLRRVPLPEIGCKALNDGSDLTVFRKQVEARSDRQRRRFRRAVLGTKLVPHYQDHVHAARRCSWKIVESSGRSAAEPATVTAVECPDPGRSSGTAGQGFPSAEAPRSAGGWPDFPTTNAGGP